jgi:hypothetical protein
MKAMTNQEKFRFWMNWTLLSFGIIPLSYMISLIVVLLVHGAFGFNQMEGGTYLSQTVMQMAGGAVIGLGTGIYQRELLKKMFNIQTSWIYMLVTGFVFTELIVCIILWKMQLNRYELRFIEFNPLPEALIFSFVGLMIGIFQWTLLRKYFSRSAYWILASAMGWGICIFVTQISIWAFFAGALLYGAVTGFFLIWVIKKIENNR